MYNVQEHANQIAVLVIKETLHGSHNLNNIGKATRKIKFKCLKSRRDEINSMALAGRVNITH